jgi:regulatory protein
MKIITEQEAYLKLTALCATAEHCPYEMQQKMQRWQIDAPTQASIIARMIEERYIDEERYARAFVKDKILYSKWGRRKIAQALWMKHIDEHIQQQVLDDVDDEEYLRVLRPLIRSKQRSTRAESTYELNTKLIRFGMSRGFSVDLIKRCLQDADDVDISDEDEGLSY